MEGTKRRLRGQLFACLSLLSVCAGAHARESWPKPQSTLELLPSSCAELPYDQSELRRLLAIELVALELRLQAGAVARSSERVLARLTVEPDRCHVSAAEAMLVVVDELSGKRIERRMAISDVVVVSRPRALAIAIVELLQSTWAEAALRPTPSAAPALPPALRRALLRRLRVPEPVEGAGPGATPGSAVFARPLSAELLPSFGISASALLRAFPGGLATLLGPQLGATARLHRRFSLDLSVELGLASLGLPFPDANGGADNVAATAVSATFGPSFIAGDEWELALGARALAGQGVLTQGPHRTSGMLFGFGIDGTLRAPFSETLSGLIGLELGSLFTPLVVKNETAADGTVFRVGLTGTWLGASLGIELDLAGHGRARDRRGRSSRSASVLP
jgi:hypothetical protein